ncbi:MAG: DUF4402 domain-containing protein [Firmicutes bacterium]|nr:DUF4402 domain-containing protein [Bacillota bacterium]
MRTFIALALVAGATSLFAAGPVGATSSASACVGVNIVAPVYVQSTQGLCFGTILMDAYDQGGTVTMVSDTKPNQNPTVKSITYDNCAAWDGTPSPAFFHYKHDSRYGVNVMVEGKVADASGNVPGAEVDLQDGVKVAITTDLPADACGFFNPLPNFVAAKHFGVAGVLTIPKNIYGPHAGTVHVTVAYK